MTGPLPSTLDGLTFAKLVHQKEEAFTFQDMWVFEPGTKNAKKKGIKNMFYAQGVGGRSPRLPKGWGQHQPPTLE